MKQICALIPFKSSTSAKQRLDSMLGQDRGEFALCLLEDTLIGLQQCQSVSDLFILTDDAKATEIAAKLGIGVINERPVKNSAKREYSHTKPIGLNLALQQAANQLANHYQSLLIVHGDLPLLDSKDIDHLIDQHKKGSSKNRISLVPDQQGRGTNCLICSPVDGTHFEYGVDSFIKHTESAIQNGVDYEHVYLPSSELDIDQPCDVVALENSPSLPPQSATAVFLRHKSVSKTKKISDDALSLSKLDLSSELLCDASNLRDKHFKNVITYSRKVFIPLTQLCRNVCHYCTFAKTPKNLDSPYMSVEQVLSVAREGQKMGCKEALFTLGERPELRYNAARDALDELGFDSTLHYLAKAAEAVLHETSLLPHINAGCLNDDEISLLKPVCASMGIMLESASERLCEKGMPHYGSPDKAPAERLATIERIGRASVPLTTGILIGIGETRQERVEALQAIQKLHLEYGHIQEIIIQNFRAKQGTLMADVTEPDLDELLWTVAIARHIFGEKMSIQVPPNLNPNVLPQLISAGINDWGGVSPLTPDFVNPESPWPHLEKLDAQTSNARKLLQERLTIYPEYVHARQYWQHQNIRSKILKLSDTAGLARNNDWFSGRSKTPPANDVFKIKSRPDKTQVASDLIRIIELAKHGIDLSETQITRLFEVRGAEFSFVCRAADQLRQQVNGNAVSFVITRNINYTNLCYFNCRFCAFSKGKRSTSLRDKPYNLADKEIQTRVLEAKERGATEVCMQGGIHPDYTGQKYIDICKLVKQSDPDMHIHAFSPLEIWQGAQTLGVSIGDLLKKLKTAGLATLPGTAAEILDDRVRQLICPDKLKSNEWLQVMREAHSLGLRSTATIMFGHLEQYSSWAKHIVKIRDLQNETGGFTEFVPLPFVAEGAPIYQAGKSRQGPSFRESVLMHAVARIALHGSIDNIQASWVKLGHKGALACLDAGANDLGGTLMNESITRSAGAEHGQETTPQDMQNLIVSAGRQAVQRNTLYEFLPNPIFPDSGLDDREPIKLTL